MNIKQAKEQIKNAMVAYFAKDAFGAYRLPPERQRPIFLLGAPGIGKTAIMEQIAQELGVGFVSYSMTHHTRQSALGLPFIAQKTYNKVVYNVSEYTMSEIIASVYDSMEETGREEGILFLDEINCVSETLTPAMLQFLQYKVFGRHRVPDGWIVVTAGNPPEYNRTAHDFDIATWDRLKRINVEPDFLAWHDYAVEKGVHPAIRTYLDIEQRHFYHLETTPEGPSFVTARGWDDLSAMIALYEEKNLPVDDLLISQYVQNAEIAKHFGVYYQLFMKYQADYHLDDIVAGRASKDLLERARNAPFDERVALMGLISDAVAQRMRTTVLEQQAVAFMHLRLSALRDALCSDGATPTTGTKDAPASYDTCTDNLDITEALRSEIDNLQHQQKAECTRGLLSAERSLAYVRTFQLFDKALEKNTAGTLSFAMLKDLFSNNVDTLDKLIKESSRMLDDVFSFVNQAFGEEQEMLLLVTDLSVNKYSMTFINEYGCEAYFTYNKSLLFSERGADLSQRIKRLQAEKPLTS